MDKSFIVESDKAIAYMLGWRIDNTFPDKGKVWRRGNALEMETTFKYSFSWEWKMEVFNKINSGLKEKYFVSISENKCAIHMEGQILFEQITASTEEATYLCFAEFAKWYNAKDLHL